MTRFLVSLVLLTLLWALALESADPRDLLTGALISGTLLFFLRGFLFADGVRHPLPGLPRRALALIPFILAVLLETIRGTWAVSLIALRLRRLGTSGIVAVPIGERSETGLLVTTLTMTLSPGSVLLDIDRGRGLLFFHVLDASDPDSFRAQQERMYERWQRHVFP